MGVLFAQQCNNVLEICLQICQQYRVFWIIVRVCGGISFKKIFRVMCLDMYVKISLQKLVGLLPQIFLLRILIFHFCNFANIYIATVFKTWYRESENGIAYWNVSLTLWLNLVYSSTQMMKSRMSVMVVILPPVFTDWTLQIVTNTREWLVIRMTSIYQLSNWGQISPTFFRNQIREFAKKFSVFWLTS